MITQGTCADVNMTPIINIDTCELAARTLGLKDTTANVSSKKNRPEGCYMLRSNTLWIAIHPMTLGRGWQQDRSPICVQSTPLFSPGEYEEQLNAAIPPAGNLHLYSVGSSNLVWMNWIDQLHYYLARLGYKMPLVPARTILSRNSPRSCTTCDDSAYFSQLRTTRLGMVGWNSWDFAYNNFSDCNTAGFRDVGDHKVKCSVGPGCIGGKFLIPAADIAHDAGASNITVLTTWFNDHKAFLTKWACFNGEKLNHAQTAEVTVPSLRRLVRAIHAENPDVWILVMGLYPPTLEYKVVESEVPWIRELNIKVKDAIEREPKTLFVDYDIPGGGLEMYDRMHYGHPNCRGAKVMVYATLQRLYEAKVLGRSLKFVNPNVNRVNPKCSSLEGAACSTSVMCWVDPSDGVCKPYSTGLKVPPRRPVETSPF